MSASGFISRDSDVPAYIRSGTVEGKLPQSDKTVEQTRVQLARLGKPQHPLEPHHIPHDGPVWIPVTGAGLNTIQQKGQFGKKLLGTSAFRAAAAGVEHFILVTARPPAPQAIGKQPGKDRPPDRLTVSRINFIGAVERPRPR